MTSSEAIHAHRWRIAEPDGRKMLPATCPCGASREFRAVDEELGWGAFNMDAHATEEYRLYPLLGRKEGMTR